MRAIIVAASLGAFVATAAAGRDPVGLRLRPVQHGEAFVAAWGDSVDQVRARVASAAANTPDTTAGTNTKASHAPKQGSLFCVDGTHEAEKVCRPFGWLADFGKTQYEFKPTILTFFNDRFYSYTLEFDADAYDFALLTITAVVGKPTETKSLPVQNAFGATFSRDWASWATAKSRLMMIRRLETISDGQLTVTYKPLEPPEAARKADQDRTQAPF